MDAEHLPCETAYEILSAQLDGEATSQERERLHLHLAGCPECQQLSAQFLQLDRRVRLRPAESVPDLRQAILSRSRPAVLGRNGWMRPALAWVALVLVIQNFTALVAGEMSGAEVHLARHLGAFGVALGVGLVFVAWRPHRAYGLLPFAGALIATMMLSAAFDIVENRRSAVSEISHIAELAGLWLVWMIAGSPGRPAWGAIRPAPGSSAPTRQPPTLSPAQHLATDASSVDNCQRSLGGAPTCRRSPCRSSNSIGSMPRRGRRPAPV